VRATLTAGGAQACRNPAQHLRGNVYVQYADAADAMRAQAALSGRFYAGRQLLVDFVPVENWRVAVCGAAGAGTVSPRG
jgi:hypothetical protein